MKRNILDFCDEVSLVSNRLKYEQALKQQAQQARKRYFAYRSHKHLTEFLEAKKKLKKLKLISD